MNPHIPTHLAQSFNITLMTNHISHEQMAEYVLCMKAPAAGPLIDPNDTDLTVSSHATALSTQAEHIGGTPAHGAMHWTSLRRDEADLRSRVGTIDQDKQLVVGYGLGSTIYLSNINRYVVDSRLCQNPETTVWPSFRVPASWF